MQKNAAHPNLLTMFLLYPTLEFYLWVAILQNLLVQYQDIVVFPVYIYESLLN